jgi:hypothetical protein
MSTRTVYIKTALTGGTTAAVDGIDGDDLLDGDVCHAYVSGVAYQYVLDDDSGATESSPDVIAPDLNAGDKRWILQMSTNVCEYGTWTPGVSFGGGTTGIAYNATYNGGHYVVIGNLVIAIGTLSLSDVGTDTGNALITGLPVSTMDSDIYGNVGVSIGYSQHLTFVDAPFAMTVKNSTTINIYKGSSGGAPTQLTNADFANNTALRLVAVYRSA